MKKILISFIFLVILSFLFIFREDGYIRTRKLNIIIFKLKNKISALETENIELEKEIYNLKYNDKYIEKIARENLKMIKQGEKIIKQKKE